MREEVVALAAASQNCTSLFFLYLSSLLTKSFYLAIIKQIWLIERSTVQLNSLNALYNNEAKYRAILVQDLIRTFEQLEEEGEPEARRLFLNDEQLSRIRNEDIEKFDDIFAARAEVSQRLRRIVKRLERQTAKYPGVPPLSSTPATSEPSTPTEVEMTEDVPSHGSPMDEDHAEGGSVAAEGSEEEDGSESDEDEDDDDAEVEPEVAVSSGEEEDNATTPLAKGKGKARAV